MSAPHGAGLRRDSTIASDGTRRAGVFGRSRARLGVLLAALLASAAGSTPLAAQTVLPQQSPDVARRDWQVNHTLIAAGTKLGMRNSAFQPLRAPRSSTLTSADPLNPYAPYSYAQIAGATIPPQVAPGLPAGYLAPPVVAQPQIAQQQILAPSVTSAPENAEYIGRRQAIAPDPWLQFPPEPEEIAAREERFRTEPLFNEIRLGFLRHDAAIFGSRKEEGFDISLELLFRSPGFLDVLGAPRPHIAGVLNTAGDTNQVYFGLAWQWEDVVFENVFAGFSLGFSYHDGALTRFDPDDIDQGKEFGHRLLFREAVEIGYAITEHHRLSFMIDHISNANIANNNEGLDSVGIRYGYKF